MSIIRKTEIAKNDLGYDAWGRPKVINDYSIFNALWTFSVPNRVWLQYNDTGAGDVEQSAIDNNLVKSTGGYLQVTGNSTTNVHLSSKRHPRYQANKGLLYSTAVILPNPTYVGKRLFGIFSDSNGVFFELVGDGVDYVLNVVRRSTNGSLTEQRVDITSLLPDGFDISKGHVYDIQMEWRGVGNFFIYVDLVKVYTFSLLGTLTGMSVSNPALPVSYECIDAGASDILIQAGCVDVTAEGGDKQNKQYTSVNTGTTLLTTNNTGKALLAVKLPVSTSYDGNTVDYTRDMIFTEMTSFCKDEAFTIVKASRLIHVANLAALAGWSTNPDSLYEFRTNSDGALDTAYQLDKASMNLIYSVRTEKDFARSHTNPDPSHTDFYLVGGDILVIELKSDGNSTGGVTLEFAEEL